MTVDGPRLIEVNINPGGLLLNAVMLDAVRSCAPAAWSSWTTAAKARNAAVAAWLDDARQQSGRTPASLAIVDSAPREQFLYPEFELYAAVVGPAGTDADFARRRALATTDTELRLMASAATIGLSGIPERE